MATDSLAKDDEVRGSVPCVRDEPTASSMAAFFRQQADQPLGDVQFASGRTLAPFSRAGLMAAENLLVKAERALAEGDLERMNHFVDRATKLNYDEHERTAPAAFAASTMLFGAVVDALERSGEGDSTWLDAAVEALASSDGWGQSAMRHTLVVISQDYVVEPSEDRAIAGAVAGVPERIDLRDLTPPTPDLAEVVRSVLQALHRYRAALTAHGR